MSIAPTSLDMLQRIPLEWFKIPLVGLQHTIRNAPYAALDCEYQMKGIVKLRTQGMGLCKLPGGQIAFWADAGGVTYLIPVQVVQDVLMANLKQYLYLKWGNETVAGFLAYLKDLTIEVSTLFDEDGVLMHEAVIDLVEVYLTFTWKNHTAGS